MPKGSAGFAFWNEASWTMERAIWIIVMINMVLIVVVLIFQLLTFNKVKRIEAGTLSLTEENMEENSATTAIQSHSEPSTSATTSAIDKQTKKKGCGCGKKKTLISPS